MQRGGHFQRVGILLFPVASDSILECSGLFVGLRSYPSFSDFESKWKETAKGLKTSHIAHELLNRKDSAIANDSVRP